MRRVNDRYFTPEFATQELCKRVAVTGSVFECCSGGGAISNVLHERIGVTALWTNDIDNTLHADFHWDASREVSWRDVVPIDWVVTNPPFSVAPKIVPLAFKYARVGVAMLLRLSYLEPCESVAASRRGRWLIGNKSNFSNLIVLPRISFTGDGKSDNVTCAWMVWKKDDLEEENCVVDWVLK